MLFLPDLQPPIDPGSQQGLREPIRIGAVPALRGGFVPALYLDQRQTESEILVPSNSTRPNCEP